MKRLLLVLITVVVMCMTAFTGCSEDIYITTGLKESEIFKISGKECRLAEMLLVLMTEKSRYEMELGDGIWNSSAQNLQMTLEDEIKHKVKNELIELKLIDNFADKQEVVVTSDEKDKIKLAANEFMLSLTAEQKKLLGVEAKDVEGLYTSFLKAEKVYRELTEDIDIEISDEEARVIEVNYIFIATCRLDEDNKKIQFVGAEREEAMSKMEQVKELLAQGNDFVTVAQHHSDSNVYNRKFARGEMVDDFERAAYNLKVGEISEPVATDDGYYFIYCVSDYLKDETNIKKVEMENAIRKSAYEEIYNPYKTEQTLEFNDKVWEKIELSEYSAVYTTDLYSIYNKHMKQ